MSEDFQKEQLKWFVKELIKESKKPEQIDYDEVIIFPILRLRDEASKLFNIKINADEDYIKDECRNDCILMLEKIKRDIPKLKKYGYEYDSFTYHLDEDNFYGYGYICIIYSEPELFSLYLDFISNKKITENKILFKKSKKSTIETPDFGDNLKWEDITIKFLNNDDVYIQIKDKVINSNFLLMGFENEKTKKPNNQWKLLKILSDNNGILDWGKTKFIKERYSFKKRKQLLSDDLKRYFQIENDEPFYDYKKEGEYRIKINLVPESTIGAEDLVQYSDEFTED